MRHLGYEVYIESEGKTLEEYAVEVDANDEAKVSCWIPSEAGKVNMQRLVHCTHLVSTSLIFYCLGIIEFSNIVS